MGKERRRWVIAAANGLFGLLLITEGIVNGPHDLSGGLAGYVGGAAFILMGMTVVRTSTGRWDITKLGLAAVSLTLAALAFGRVLSGTDVGREFANLLVALFLLAASAFWARSSDRVWMAHRIQMTADILVRNAERDGPDSPSARRLLRVQAGWERGGFAPVLDVDGSDEPRDQD